MTSGHAEDLVYKIWKDAYREGYGDGWDRGLDRAATLLRGRVPDTVLAELAELAGAPEEPVRDAQLPSK